MSTATKRDSVVGEQTLLYEFSSMTMKTTAGAPFSDTADSS